MKNFNLKNLGSKNLKSKSFKVILFAAFIFLYACGSADKAAATVRAKRGVPSISYDSLDAPIKIEIENGGEQADTVIRSGRANVYRRSSIEASANENAASAGMADAFDPVVMTGSERAKRLSQAIINIKGIDKATVAISGHTAIVGIEYAGHLDNLLLMKMKKEVDDIAKATDKGINNVAITATPELVKRVTKMSNSEMSDRNNSDEDITRLIDFRTKNTSENSR